MRPWLAFFLMLSLGIAHAQHNPAHREGVSAGQGGNSAIGAYVNAGSAASVIPNYGQTAAESSLYGQALPAYSAERIAACQRQPNDPACQGILTAWKSAQTPRSPIPPSDPSLAGAKAIARNPYSLVSNLTGYYSGCRADTTLQSPALFDTQSCHTYYLREPDQGCIKSLTVMIDYSCPPGTSGPFPGQGGQICLDAVSGKSQPAAISERDVWDNQCSALESRVPPGFLLLDGDNSLPAGNAVSDILNKCERKTSVCLDPEATKYIEGRAVTRACWQFQNIFDCLSSDLQTDCNTPRVGQCTPSATTCVDSDTIFQQPVCTATRTDFKCLLKDEVRKQTANCGDQQYCLDGNCWDVGYRNDTDFARSVAMLEATREGGKYFEASGAKVFKGFDNRCVKKLFGLVNCCNRAGSNSASLFNNLSVLLAAGKSVGGAVTSTYTYDALFASDAPNFVISGFEALFGQGSNSALAGLFAGDISVSQFMTTLVPGPWAVALLAIQYSGLFSCPEKEKVVAMKRDANLCVTVGSYCSRRLPIIKTCMEQTTSFCCFNSKLARIINTMGRQQLGRSFGAADNPNCDGFTIAEFQQLDFSRMDLSEFYAEIIPKSPDLQAIANRIQNTVNQCYYGTGKCPP